MHNTNEGRFLEFDGVQKTYDEKSLVVRDFSLTVRRGEFLTLLGPSGSGKTTVLMMLAGFETVTAGVISINGRSITRTAPHQRNIGVVFQNYALFPHMTVADNLAYPLTLRRMSKTQVSERVKQYLKLVELEGYGDRQPAQLSGGQRQRVALARALIFEPELVLMDEPLGALDKKLREQMQLEITRLHKKLGFTVIYVTHDQNEALTMSDRVAVFNRGVVQQCASPAELYEKPANAFVADFIGENNMVPGTVVSVEKEYIRAELPGGSTVAARRADCGGTSSSCLISVRPEKITMTAGAAGDSVNGIEARFVESHYVGDFIRYYFCLADGSPIVAKVLNHAQAPQFVEGQAVTLGWTNDDSHAFQSPSHSAQGTTP